MRMNSVNNEIKIPKALKSFVELQRTYFDAFEMEAKANGKMWSRQPQSC
jgi:hypothetical protein